MMNHLSTRYTRSRAAALTMLAVLLLAAGCGSSESKSTKSNAKSGGSSSKSASVGCTAGPTTKDGVKVMQHCGDATAEVVYDGTTVKYSGGACQQTESTWALNIGHTVIDTAATDKQRAAIKYLGISGGDLAAAGAGETKAGKFDTSNVKPADFVVTFATGDVADSIQPDTLKFELADDGNSGTFSGTTLRAHVEASGKFSCS